MNIMNKISTADSAVLILIPEADMLEKSCGTVLYTVKEGVLDGP